MKQDDKDDLRILFHARSVSTSPNDGQARKDQLGEATATAQAHIPVTQILCYKMSYCAAGACRLIRIKKLSDFLN